MRKWAIHFHNEGTFGILDISKRALLWNWLWVPRMISLPLGSILAWLVCSLGGKSMGCNQTVVANEPAVKVGKSQESLQFFNCLGERPFCDCLNFWIIYLHSSLAGDIPWKWRFRDMELTLTWHKVGVFVAVTGLSWYLWCVAQGSESRSRCRCRQRSTCSIDRGRSHR